jgi:YidC/Oxa1 family membrane protein insertase
MNQNNNEQKQSTQQRLFVVMLLSFVFFLAYDFLYVQPTQQAQAQQQQQAAPDVKNAANNNAPSSSTAGNAAPATKSVDAQSIVTTITTKRNVIQIDNLGRVAQVKLLETQYDNDEGEHIKLFASNQLRPLEVRFANREINTAAFKTPFVASATNLNATTSTTELTLTQKLPQTTVTKTLKFYPDGHYDVTINATNDAEFFVTPGFRPDVLADMYADHGALLKNNDGTLTIVEDGDLDRTESFTGVKFASAFDRYYATVLYNFDKSMAVSMMPDLDDNPQMFIHGKDTLSLSGYMGPKDFRKLEALNTELTDVIEYGWFTFIAKPMFLMLQFFHDYVGNWGWTIVLVTIVIKLILYPLAYKGMVSMNRLKDLAPKVKEIQEKYKDDKQKAGAKMMELYKKEGANPMGGCLPILLQIPVFFAIYRVLLNATELQGAEWMLWIQNLAEMDPYFILPILMGVSMYVQQRITPTQIQDEMQKKIFQWLPVIFTFFFLWFPAGLTLYWFVNNLFTIAQQYYVNTKFEKAKLARHEEHLAKKHKKD